MPVIFGPAGTDLAEISIPAVTYIFNINAVEKNIKREMGECSLQNGDGE